MCARAPRLNKPSPALRLLTLLRRAPQSLLSMYGIDELSDTDGESELPENPMSPQQIALMLDRQIALTRELDIDDAPGTPARSGEPPPAPSSRPAAPA